MAFMKSFRKHQGKALLILGVFLMVTWFIGGSLMRLVTPAPSQGTVFGKTVTPNEFRDARETLLILNAGATVEDNDVWDFIVLEREATHMGVRVSSSEITDGLRMWVQARTQATNENIDTAYQMLLQRARTNDDGARAAVSRELMVDKMLQMVAGAAMPTDATLFQEFLKEDLQVKLKTLEAASVNYVGEVAKPTEEQLASYYKENAEKYRLPQRANVEYVSALKKDYEQMFPVTGDEIAAYYEQRKSEDYMLPPKAEVDSSAAVESSGAAVDSSALSESTTATASAAPAVESTESTEAGYKPLSEVTAEIRGKLQDQKAINALNEAMIDMNYHKELTLSAQAQKYALPYALVEDVSEADKDKLPGLADATVSGDKPVMGVIFPTPPSDAQLAEGPAGAFLFRVTDMKEAKQPELAEIKDRVESDYIKAEADKLAMADAARQLEELRAKGWDALKDNAKYKVEESPLGRTAKFEGLVEAAYTVNQGDFGGPVLGPDGAYVFQVVERKEPDIATFNGYKEYYKAMYMMSHQRTFIDEWRQELMKRANVQKVTGPVAPEAPISPSGYY